MGMTITEKILAKHADRDSVKPGDHIWIDADILMTHDVCGPATYAIFKREFGADAKIWNREKVVVIPDHYIFTKDLHAGRQIEQLRVFAKEQNLVHFYDVGTPRYKGVCHVAMAEEGFDRPGQVLFGTDSHTCTAGAFGCFATGIGNSDAAFVLGTGKLWVKVPHTCRFEFFGKKPPYITAKDMILTIINEIGIDGATYKAMEFAGEAVHDLGIEARMTLCNMAVEAGAKNGIIEPDETVFEFVNQRSRAGYDVVTNDPDARFEKVFRYDVSKLIPLVAGPHSPQNGTPVTEAEGTRLDQAYIGSCTGGKLSDFIAAAAILKSGEVKIPTYAVPATVSVEQGLKETLMDGMSVLEILEFAGVNVGPPSCAACLGGPPDTFGRLNHSEVCISTTNRNFPGRMGSKESRVYLASPYTVAASALTGKITDPRRFMN
ncbi:2,3-dimethylmalate dehydratase large subunit [bacterium BMS3Abin05]|nr:2,3-dimethylmalate dehydratase large subunit [bacterium BMS3Abin05]